MRASFRVQEQEVRWFAAAVAQPNLSRVAERLHVSQPALSRSLRRVEAVVGSELFDRVGRSLEPNALGHTLAGHVNRALAELDDSVAAVRQAADPDQGEVRLAFLHTFGTWLVPELIRAYRPDRPGVRFRLSQDSAVVTREGLLAGRHDLLVTSPRPEHAG